MRALTRAVRSGINSLGYDLVRRPPDRPTAEASMSPDVSALFVAAERGDAATVQTLLATGIEANVRRSDGVTPLVLAAANGQLAAADALLKNGADPNLDTSEGWYAYHFAKNAKHAAVAARLLEAHGGKEPVYDYAAAFLRKADPKQLALYRALFSADAIANKRFVNVSAGHWRHPYWTNTEYASDWYHYDRTLIDVPWDISLFKPVAIETGSIELAYCSHTTEHLTDEQDRHMFHEVHRILKPGGVFRVTCPNVELYHQAYKRGDTHIGQHYGSDEPYGEDVSLAVWFVNEIASQLVQNLGDHIAPMRDPKEVERLLAAMPLEEACDYFCSRIDYELHRKFPGNHINWWTHDKMCRELKAAGFKETIVSIAGACVSPGMRDRTYFDTINPTFSLFVDAIR